MMALLTPACVLGDKGCKAARKRQSKYVMIAHIRGMAAQIMSDCD
jgi:hypothetical protein